MNKLEFSNLETCLNDNIKWGMYDKLHTPNEKHDIYKGVVPKNAIASPYKTDGYELHVVLSRNDFPLKNSDGTDKYYFGWYALVPFDKKIVAMDENGGSPLNPNHYKLKNADGTDLVLSDGGVDYSVYGMFNIAKTSNNWYLHIKLQDTK